MKPSVNRKRARCVFCDTDKNVQHHHIGGRNHIVWLTAALCRAHHDQCHRLLEINGVDLQYTSNTIKRLNYALMAITIFMFMIQGELQRTLSQDKQ
jgi:hypothetical protein